MDQYHLLWGLHVATAGISVSLFAWRFWLDESGRHWRRTPLRFVPHINDTVLLAAAIGLCAVTGWRPWLHGWLGAKVLLLLVYIGLAATAFRQRSRWRARAFALAALLTVTGIFTLALLKPALA